MTAAHLLALLPGVVGVSLAAWSIIAFMRGRRRIIAPVVETAKDAGKREGVELGGCIRYLPIEQAALAERFENAQETIQVLTAKLTIINANYMSSILEAMLKADAEGRVLEVTILTLDPDSPFAPVRAEQLDLNPGAYQSELKGSLMSAASRLLREKNCRVFTYRDFPLHWWYRIDDTIYIQIPSLLRRSHRDGVFATPLDVPGIREKFLDHFEDLKSRARPFGIDTHASENR